MGLVGWFFISRYGPYSGNNYGYGGLGLSQTGRYLYYLLSIIQLFLILFITPAFTATAINGEKERQTFDLLLCSRLSSFSLVSGKLIAGLVNALLLIAASIPLFSLVFFFGGVAPSQLLLGLLVYLVTTIMIGTFGLLCSTFIARPAASTAITYLGGVIWIVAPLLIIFILSITGGFQGSNGQNALYFVAWNPVYALVSTYPDNTGTTYHIVGHMIGAWVIYTPLCLIAAVLFFFLSLLAVKPTGTYRPLVGKKSHKRASTTKGQVQA